MKKYELTGEKFTESYYDSRGDRKTAVVYRIRALVDIPEHKVHAGDIGGWVEKEENLSHEGKCWLGNGIICGESYVSGDVLIGDINIEETYSGIRGSSKIDATGIMLHVSVENSTLKGNLNIYSCMLDDSTVSGNVSLDESDFLRCKIEGNVEVSGAVNLNDSKLSDCSKVINTSAGLLFLRRVNMSEYSRIFCEGEGGNTLSNISLVGEETIKMT